MHQKTKLRGWFCALVAVASLSATGTGARADCHPLTLLVSLDMVPTASKTAEYVPVELQGKPGLMLLDTGGMFTEVTSKAADDLSLPRQHANVELLDVAGNSTDEFATASLALGRLKADSVAFMVATPGTGFGNDPRIVGLLGPDILSHYDVSLDFGTNKFDLLSPDHCEGKVIYWPASAVAVVPMRLLASKHIVASVTLDGKPVEAIIDTGAWRSTLKLPAAETYYGLTMGSADTPAAGELMGNSGVETYRHTFKSLMFDGIAVSNPEVIIIPDMVGDKLANRPPIGSLIPDRKYDEAKPDMLIGMDVLRHLHLYIAYKENKLYVTPAGTPTVAAH